MVECAHLFKIDIIYQLLRMDAENFEMTSGVGNTDVDLPVEANQSAEGQDQ